MRVSKRRALTLSALAGAALLWSGCEAKKQTEYVTGISTQVQVPRDLKTIRVDINVGGVPAFCRAYAVYDGRVQLPRSLGSLPVSGANLGEPITVTIVGFTEEITDPSRQDVYDCGTGKPIQAGVNARILRRSRQPYRQDSILFLPMALRFSCFDKDCETSGQDKTCKAGKCVDAATDERKLPVFSDDLVDGKGGACFKASDCMGAAAPPAVVNPDDCTYALPNTPSAPPIAQGVPPNPFPKSGDGVNVRVVYDGGFNGEILDNDPDEGFIVPDPSKPQQFRLAPGLCEMVKGYDADGKAVAHRITGVFASGTCQAKTATQPLCEKDMLQSMGADVNGLSKSASIGAAQCNPIPLKPPPAALLVMADATANSQNLGNQSAAVNITLSNPAFEKTNVALMYFPGTAACNGAPQPTSNFPLAVQPENARTARDKIFASFASTYAPLLGSTDFSKKSDLDGALAAGYDFLRTSAPDAYKRAVILLANHDFGTATCGTDLPTKVAGDAFTNASGVSTYVFILAKDAGQAAPPADNQAADPVYVASFGLAQAGSGGAHPVYDTRYGSDGKPANGSNDQVALNGMTDVVNELATCVYDAPTPLKDGQVLTYTDPIGGKTVRISQAAAGTCTDSKGAGTGWGKDASGRIYICGQPCGDYRGVLQTAAAYSLQYKQPAIAVPMFAHDAACAPEAGGLPSGQPIPSP